MFFVTFSESTDRYPTSCHATGFHPETDEPMVEILCQLEVG